MDRNSPAWSKKIGRLLSLSARRAWIEMQGADSGHKMRSESLSARRAWIEISGVDFAEDWLNGRSPQGERG